MTTTTTKKVNRTGVETSLRSEKYTSRQEPGGGARLLMLSLGRGGGRGYSCSAWGGGGGGEATHAKSSQMECPFLLSSPGRAHLSCWLHDGPRPPADGNLAVGHLRHSTLLCSSQHHQPGRRYHFASSCCGCKDRSGRLFLPVNMFTQCSYHSALVWRSIGSTGCLIHTKQVAHYAPDAVA